ncbi:unannotated protein [freshwater metagenome]|uniref:Unannotated protein n=1 Tax=freshwater metagenome TaxID=449393 RepID=A0A6J6QRN4_9ZZZZ
MIEVAGSVIGRHGSRTRQRRVELSEAHVHEHPYRCEVRVRHTGYRGFRLLKAAQRIVGTAELYQTECPRYPRLAGEPDTGAVVVDGELGGADCPVRLAQLRSARRLGEQHEPLHLVHIAEEVHLLHRTLVRRGPAERCRRPGERGEREQFTETIAHALEPRPRRLALLECVLGTPAPEPEVRLEGLHHPRRPVVTAIECFLEHPVRQFTRLVGTALVVTDISQQTLHPAETTAIAHGRHAALSEVEARLGLHKVARDERQPCPVPLHPGEPDRVRTTLGKPLRLVEQLLREVKIPAKEFDERSVTQCPREPQRLADLTEQPYCLGELAARAGQVPAEAHDRSEDPSGLGLGLEVPEQCAGTQHPVEVRPCACDISLLGVRRRPDQAEAEHRRHPRIVDLLAKQVETPCGETDGRPHVVLLGRALRGEGQPPHGSVDDVARHARHGPEFRDQFGSGGVVVCDLVPVGRALPCCLVRAARSREQHEALVDHCERLRDPVVPDGANCLGECVVRDVPHGLRTEAPAPAFTREQPGVHERIKRRAVSVLPECLREAEQCRQRTGGAKHRCVVEHRPLVRGQLVQAGRHQCSQGVRQVADVPTVRHERCEFLKEQWIAATPVIQRGNDCRIGRVAEDCCCELFGGRSVKGLEPQVERREQRAHRGPRNLHVGARRCEQHERQVGEVGE